MSPDFTRLIIAVVLTVSGLTPTGGWSQDYVVPDTLNASITDLEASGDSPEALATLREAAAAYSKAGELADNARRFQQQIDAVPAQLTDSQKSLSDLPPEEPNDTEIAARPLEQLETSVNQTKTTLEQARSKQQKLDTELQQSTLKKTAIPASITQLTTNLENLSNLLQTAQPLTQNPSQEDLATRTNQLAQQLLLRQTITTNERELAFINASADLTAIQHSLVERDIKRLTSLLEITQRAVDSKRRMQAESEAAQARSDADRSTDIPAVATLAQENADLAALRAGDQGVTARLRTANKTLADVTSQLDSITGYYHNAKRRVDLVTQAGFSLGESTGELLRSERNSLPDIDDLEAQTHTALHDNTSAGLELIKLEKRRRDLVIDSETMIDDIIATLPPAAEAGRATAETAARRILESRRELLDQLVTEYRTLTSTVSEANRKRQALIARTSDYARLIDERVLWFRSAPVIDLGALKTGARSIATVFSPDRWTEFFRIVGHDIRTNIALWIAAALAVGLLVSRRPSHKKHLESASISASKGTSRNYLPTAKALTYTLLLTLPGPLALWFVAVRHGGTADGGIATGLFEIACQILVFGFVRRACYKNGLAVGHFRLQSQHARTLHVTLTRFLWVAAPIAFVLGVLDTSDGHPGARLVFIVAMLVFVGFVLRLLKPSRHLFTSPGLRAGAFLFGVVAPLILVTGAGAGYFYTVRELQWRLEASMSLVLVLLLLNALIQRWFLIARRRLAVEQAGQQQRASTESSTAPTDPVALTPEEVESATIDITRIKDQTRQLLRSAMAVALAFGLWGIWSQVLPALNIFDGIHLWPDTTELASATTTPDSATPTPPPSPLAIAPPAQAPGTETTAPAPAPGSRGLLAMDYAKQVATDPHFGWVTLADVALSLLTFILTYIAAKNIPGLLDISLLRRLALKPGGSFAVTASARYLIVLVGVILAFSQIGITWSKVQWIAAAVTVGIGFGLQEVFANFVAGLILLFERPIRLGDFVTIGTTSGQVTRIEIRATTIRDFSNKELIVPNKEFITGQLVNWTLTDSVIRVEIPVGIAYGSDTVLARKLLEEIGAAHPLTKPEPPAQAVFLNFGASSLDFELRAHINSAQDLISVRNDLNFAIDKAFREHHIEIAFPQTDIHIRSMPPQPRAGS